MGDSAKKTLGPVEQRLNKTADAIMQKWRKDQADSTGEAEKRLQEARDMVLQSLREVQQGFLAQDDLVFARSVDCATGYAEHIGTQRSRIEISLSDDLSFQHEKDNHRETSLQIPIPRGNYRVRVLIYEIPAEKQEGGQ